MPKLESRLAALESRVGVVEDGRDPGMVELCKIIAESEGRPFNIEDVPRNFTVAQLLDLIAGSEKSRGSDIIAARRR